ncbi:S-adenosyl-L-methionine-dependent methyltransferase [Gymnopus androsaceus JB14]|uniref:S-adenosyl-L-methionine-dependent methyltransferase n=1 Tax=Gymnopus androsaceus JB14 TaxID=1447944 RepID=A0A6A4GX31_9AGAR|nr:S-adenosyl-L-methionine-dependent methyltransferase [Gymnopus androsaceus JB14]
MNVLPWDAGEIQPPLRQVIEGGEVPFPKEGKALVPGCGRGYDAIYLASALGHDTIGLDCSATAVEAAQKLLQSHSVSPELASKIHFDVEDFFKLKVNDDKRFDLIYDYTFFVALPPIHRSLWGTQMRALVKPGGYLITLMFPLVSEPFDNGPPFYTDFDSYKEALGDGWEVVLDKIPDDATLAERHKGKDRVVVWKRNV